MQVAQRQQAMKRKWDPRFINLINKSHHKFTIVVVTAAPVLQGSVEGPPVPLVHNDHGGHVHVVQAPALGFLSAKNQIKDDFWIYIMTTFQIKPRPYCLGSRTQTPLAKNQIEDDIWN